MAARDGLLARLRITGGIVPAATARALANLAARHGNGLFDLSARGNLQMRGIRDLALPALHEGLRALGLLDADADGEAVRNVLSSPLAGLREDLDVRPLVAALEARLAGDAFLHGLPSKFGFLVDDGGAPSLAAIAADVRFDWLPATQRFSIGLGGRRADAHRIGTCAADELVTRAATVATGALTLSRRAPERGRVRHLVEDFGIEAVAGACGGTSGEAVAPSADHGTPRSVGRLDVAGPTTLGLGAPFGRLDSAMLRVAADLAEAGGGELRLTPWRVLFAPTIAPRYADLAYLAQQGFIVDAGDPRLAVVACVGRDGCARGTTATRDDAAALAELADRTGSLLHVSGCEKGCAHPAAAPITLVGRAGRYDLVRDGRASDPPARAGLDLADAAAAIAALLEPA